MNTSPAGAFFAAAVSLLCWQLRINFKEKQLKLKLLSDDKVNRTSTVRDDEQREQLQQLLSGDQKVYKFVLTGGPCSGKTTALERLQVFLRERGAV
jgi:predicted NACHT family NTPase